MKKFNLDKTILYVSALAVAGLITYVIQQEVSRSEVVYIDISKMAEGYKFKKDLEAEGTKNLYHIKNTIDSLKMIDKVNDNPVVDSQVFYAERAFEQYYTVSNQEITKKVWDRLNPILEEFGKHNHYELIVGANGAGTVLYGAKKNDVTQEAINYINSRYEKGN